MNSVKIYDDSGIITAEVYEHKLMELTDIFIEQCLNGESEKIKDNFLSLLLYASDRLEKVPHDIDVLDGIFQVYLRLCFRYGVSPTLESFGFLVGMDSGTFSDWMSGRYRTNDGRFSQTAKKWKTICRAVLIHELSNTSGGSINKIFIAKSVYGLAETAPIQTEVIEKQAKTAEQLPDFRQFVNDD